jgi:hypothetical protein
VLVAVAPAVNPVQVAHAGLATTTYPVIGSPPFEAGALHDTVAAPAPLATAAGVPGAEGGDVASATTEAPGLTVLSENPATPMLWTAAKCPATEEPQMIWSEVPVAGGVPVECTANVPPRVTGPDAQSPPALGVPDVLSTVSTNVPAVCR